MTLGQIWRNAFLRDLLFSALSMATRGNRLRLKQKVQRRFSVVPGWSQAHLICPIMSGHAILCCHLNLRFWDQLWWLPTFYSAKSSSHSAHSHLSPFYWSLNLQFWMLNEEESRRMQSHFQLSTFKPIGGVMSFLHVSTTLLTGLLWLKGVQVNQLKPIETEWYSLWKEIPLLNSLFEVACLKINHIKLTASTL